MKQSERKEHIALHDTFAIRISSPMDFLNIGIGIIIVVISITIFSQQKFNFIFALFKNVHYHRLPSDTKFNEPSTRAGKHPKKVDLPVFLLKVRGSYHLFSNYQTFIWMYSLFFTSCLCLIIDAIFRYFEMRFSVLPHALICFTLFCLCANYFVTQNRHFRFSLLYLVLCIIVTLGFSQETFSLGPADLRFFCTSKRSLQAIMMIGVFLFAVPAVCSSRSYGFLDKLYNSPERIYNSKREYETYKSIFGFPKTIMWISENHSFIVLLWTIGTRFYYRVMNDFFADCVIIAIETLGGILSLYFSKYWIQFEALDTDRLFVRFHEDRSKSNALKCQNATKKFESRFYSKIASYVFPGFLHIFSSLLFLLSLISKPGTSEKLHVLAIYLSLAFDVYFSIAMIFHPRKKNIPMRQ